MSARYGGETGGVSTDMFRFKDANTDDFIRKWSESLHAWFHRLR